MVTLADLTSVEFREFHEPVSLTIPSHYGDTRVPNRSTLRIQNKTFFCHQEGQTALSLRWPSGEPVATRDLEITGCQFQPGTKGWKSFLYLENCNAPLITISGYGGMTLTNADGGGLGDAIVLNGQTMDAIVFGCYIVGAYTTVLVAGECEGVQFIANRFLACYHGVAAITPQPEAGLWAEGNHITAARAPFLLVRRPQAFFSNNLLYRHPWRADGAAWEEIAAIESNPMFVSNNLGLRPWGI